MFVIYIYQLNSDKMNGWYDRTTTFKGFVACIVDVDICLKDTGRNVHKRGMISCITLAISQI